MISNLRNFDRKFSKWLENTVGKGEIARYEQFLLFPQCFQKTCTADTIGQTFCFANRVQNKGSLRMFCIAPGAFIRINTVSYFYFASCTFFFKFTGAKYMIMVLIMTYSFFFNSIQLFKRLIDRMVFMPFRTFMLVILW